MATKECNLCKLNFSTTNFSKHYKICQQKHNVPTPEQLQDTINQLKRQLEASKIELTKANYRIEELTKENQRLVGNNNKLVDAVASGSGSPPPPSHQVINITNNTTTDNSIKKQVNNIHYHYVLDANGIRDGLDMKKLRNFGEEDVSYVDKTQPLPKILKDIYYNEDHMENRVISHEFPNREWMIFKCQDYLIRLHLETDRESVPLMEDLVCNNVQKLLGKKFETCERRDAIKELLSKFDDEARKLTKGIEDEDEIMKRLPIWNHAQYENYKELIYNKSVHDPTFVFTYPERMYFPQKYQ